ncbi:hypothetical protein JCM19301_3755 [Jejuia pallidilutea]|uniref:O-antigen ligase-related domain-containing protein n=2 Tax=Jejuia pallidilutea TaxID=504487 RepID=A0A090W1J4_9FLAO|nr:hypothetical protein JCM19301_3755 [Jejuia pallidilutea]GAL69354.1 hypothetical protein JCM19302_4083 [Jejuia pallidilutea]GAL89121.1 hypothetical protein JCM19538_2110 [Jejuia pallidilutea]
MENRVNRFFSLLNAQFLFLLLVPFTLFFSLKLNSVVIIILLGLTIKDVVKERTLRIKLFLPSLLYVLSVLIGFFIDYYYGFSSIKNIEKMLPFLALPVVFFLGIKNKFKANRIIQLFGYLITIVNLFLIIFAIIITIKNATSNQFISDLWVKTGAKIVVLETETNPVGKNNVAKLVEGSEYGLHDLLYKSQEKIKPETNYIRSVFLKKSERDWVLIRQYDGITHKGIWFNISEGYVGKAQKGLTGKIESYGNGWFRCSVVNKTSEMANQERLQITLVKGDGKYKYKGDGVSGIFVWGGELNEGKNNKSYLPSQYNLNFNQFYRENLLRPLNTHPSYYSLYIVTVLVFFLLMFFTKKRVVDLLVIIFNTLILVLISSKAALFSFIIVLVFLSTLYIRKSKKHFFLLLAVLSIFTISILIFPKVKHRIEQSVETVLFEKNKKLSTYKRILVLKGVLDFDKEALVLGKGNVNGERLLREKTGLDLNAHNQYLQALISSGIVGVIFLLIYLFSPLYYINNLKTEWGVFTVCIVIVFSINFLFESMLNRQWGIVFVAYIYSLLKKTSIKW